MPAPAGWHCAALCCFKLGLQSSLLVLLTPPLPVASLPLPLPLSLSSSLLLLSPLLLLPLLLVPLLLLLSLPLLSMSTGLAACAGRECCSQAGAGHKSASKGGFHRGATEMWSSCIEREEREEREGHESGSHWEGG